MTLDNRPTDRKRRRDIAVAWACLLLGCGACLAIIVAATRGDPSWGMGIGGIVGAILAGYGAARIIFIDGEE